MKEIIIPKDLARTFKLRQSSQVTASLISGGHLVLRNVKEKPRNSISTWVLVVLTAALSVGFYSWSTSSQLSQIPMTGTPSIFAALLLTGGPLSLFIFLITFIKNRHHFLNGLPNRVFWRILPIVFLAFLAIMILGILGLSWLFEQLFKGASFDSVTSSFVLGILSFILSVVMRHLAEELQGKWLTTLFVVIIIGGVMLAMISNQNDQWWQFNLSFLGTHQAKNNWSFNITLILSALILLALIDYLFVALRVYYGKSKRLLLLESLLMLLAVDLGAVGYFPNNARLHDIHTAVASYLVYLIIVLIVSIKWLLPEVTRDFLMTSYTIGGLMLIQVIGFYGLDYLSLTVFELLSFMLAFSWIILLFNHLERLIQPKSSDDIYLLKIID